MDVLRERDEKDNLERKLHEEQKIRATLQKRLRREKRSKKRVQDQLDLEINRRAQLEEALRKAGATEQLASINDKMAQLQQKQHTQQSQKSQSPASLKPSSPVQPPPPTPDRNLERVERIKQEVEEGPQQYLPPRDMREQVPPPIPHQENKPWGYTGIDLMGGNAAFWQNYSESFAQEMEMERKSRQQHQAEREVKSPLQDRGGYYQKPVMFTSSAT